MSFRPCIDLHKGLVKQIIGSSLSTDQEPKTNFISQKPAAYYAEMYKKNFALKLLDGVGNVVERWNIIGAWPMSVNFGELDYTSSDLVTATMSIRMDECRLEY